MGAQKSNLSSVKAILFDMHQTITETEGFLALTRRVANSTGIDLSKFTDEEIQAALERHDEWFKRYQIDQDVDIHFGNEVEHWTDANRMMFESLGFDDLTDDVLISVEINWKEGLKTWETLKSDVKETLFELHRRGYKIGICTRRPDDPTELLRDWGILEIMSTVQWSAVPGYAKPNPYTLILAAEEMRVNPRRCVYVGDSKDADIVAAQRAGMFPILTTWAKAEEAKKALDGALIISDVSELLDLFEGQPE
jgi:HAD superfamily hydrolase (TIGR01549 family)